MYDDLELLNDYRKIKKYIEEVNDSSDNKPKTELKNLEQALQQLLAIQKGKNIDIIDNLMNFKNAEPFNPFLGFNDPIDSEIYSFKSALINKSPKELAFEKIKSTLDTFYTSDILTSVGAIKIIDDIIKEIPENER